RNYANHGSSAQVFRALGAGDNQGSGAIVYAGSVACRDRAIFLECGFQSTQAFNRGVFAWRFILVEDHVGLTFFLRWNFNWNDLGFEAAFFNGRDCLAMGVHREPILLFARDAIFFGNILARDAHVVIVVNIPKPIVDHG